MNTLSEEDKTWLAATLEADGSFRIALNSEGRGSASVYIGTATYGMAEKARRITGFEGSASWRWKRSKNGRQRAYEWEVRGEKAYEVCRAIWPKLNEKHDQVAALMAFVERQRAYGRHKLSDEEQRIRGKLIAIAHAPHKDYGNDRDHAAYMERHPSNPWTQTSGPKAGHYGA